MSDLYHEKLNSIAQQVGVSSDDVLACLTHDVPPQKHKIFVRDGIYLALSQILWANNEGIYLCLIHPDARQVFSMTPREGYIAELYSAIEHDATKQGYSTSYHCNNLFLANENYFESLLRKYPKAGVVYMIPHGAVDLASVCRKLNMPLLLLDYHVDQGMQEFYTLSLNNRVAAQKITRLLIDYGHRQIAHITGSLNHLGARDRLAGYQDALKQAGIAYNPNWVMQGNWQRERAEEEVMRLFQRPNYPTAIMCANDLSAMGAYDAIARSGLRIPQDISVTGIDDIRISRECDPPLTTVRQPIEQVGEKTARLMIQIMQGGQPVKQHFFEQLNIIERASVAPPCR